MPVVDQSFDLLLDRLAQTLGAAAVELRVATPFAGDPPSGVLVTRSLPGSAARPMRSISVS